jgi:hypothetical protein
MPEVLPRASSLHLILNDIPINPFIVHVMHGLFSSILLARVLYHNLSPEMLTSLLLAYALEGSVPSATESQHACNFDRPLMQASVLCQP